MLKKKEIQLASSKLVNPIGKETQQVSLSGEHISIVDKRIGNIVGPLHHNRPMGIQCVWAQPKQFGILTTKKGSGRSC